MLASAVCAQAVAAGSSATYSDIPGVDCVINPYKVADIASPVAGVIDELYVERSQQVNAGQVVAQLDAKVERASVALARYRAGIQSEIKLGQVNMTFDRLRSKRIKSLSEKQAISLENIDEAKREAGLSKWKLQQARELAEVRQLELQRAEEQLLQKSIKAPFDGFVLDTFKHRGEYVEDQTIMRLAQLNPLVIEAIVPMENFGKIKVGMDAEIVPEALSGEKLTGKVSIVDRIGDTASNTFGVRLVMPNPENRIPAGIKCVVKFIQQSDEVIAAEASEPKRTMTEKDIVAIMLGTIAPSETAQPEITQLVTDQVEIEQVDTVQVETAPTGVVETAYLQVGDYSAEDIGADNEATEKLTNNTSVSNKQKSTTYLVVTEQGETTQDTHVLIDQLQQAGVKDMLEMDHGFYKGLISLGIYKNRHVAIRRQQQLASLGFTTYISERK